MNAVCVAHAYHGVGVRVQVQNADDGESSFSSMVKLPGFVDVGPAPITNVTIGPWEKKNRIIEKIREKTAGQRGELGRAQPLQ